MAVRKNDGGSERSRLNSQLGSRKPPEMPWLPMPEAPANDNELELIWIVRAFFARHLNWLVPTVALAAFSLTLLFLRS